MIHLFPSPSSPRYLEANMDTGKVAWGIFSALQGFWPGMQVLAGDVAMAAETGTLHIYSVHYARCTCYLYMRRKAARDPETRVHVCSCRLVSSLFPSPLFVQRRGVLFIVGALRVRPRALRPHQRPDTGTPRRGRVPPSPGAC